MPLNVTANRFFSPNQAKEVACEIKIYKRLLNFARPRKTSLDHLEVGPGFKSLRTCQSAVNQGFAALFVWDCGVMPMPDAAFVGMGRM